MLYELVLDGVVVYPYIDLYAVWVSVYVYIRGGMCVFMYMCRCRCTCVTKNQWIRKYWFPSERHKCGLGLYVGLSITLCGYIW